MSAVRTENRDSGFSFGPKDALFRVCEQSDSLAAVACGAWWRFTSQCWSDRCCQPQFVLEGIQNGRRNGKGTGTAVKLLRLLC
ncbi:hypothetical protein AB3S75_032346 [Citrus x aurantiifolia]